MSVLSLFFLILFVAWGGPGLANAPTVVYVVLAVFFGVAITSLVCSCIMTAPGVGLAGVIVCSILIGILFALEALIAFGAILAVST